MSASESGAGERARRIPSSPELECDLVMKGGITSGVVYPSAVLELAQQYRFRSIGGASVGAVAAAVVAAAEYGRQRGQGAAFAELESMNEEIVRPGFLLGLFQPRPSARPLFEVLTAGMEASPSRLRRLLRLLGVLLRRGWAVVVPLLVLWLGGLTALGLALGRRWWVLPAIIGAWGVAAWLLTWALGGRFGRGLVGGAAALGLAVAWPVLVAPLPIGLRGFRDLGANAFGMCPGTAPEGSAPALTEWLHQHVQGAAGPTPGGRPLTFGDLREAGIDLQMMTTNLSTARPVRLPREAEGYLFRREDLEPLFPEAVLRHVLNAARPAPDPALADEGYLRMPKSDDLPVLVGFRMSLSFPLLFTAVRLHSLHERDPRRVVPIWLSDGGIGSNFPIHFFDAWLPGRPTFGLSLGPFPQDPDGGRVPGEGAIGLPVPPTDVRFANWISVPTVGSFLHQIAETMQNWRDTMQAELPGFQDRVFEVRLSGEEGGLNLGMTPETIRGLIEKGEAAGRAIREHFDWPQHFFTRYVTFMQMMQIGLAGDVDPVGGRRRLGVAGRFADRREDFARGDVGARELFGHDAAWLREAGDLTWELAEDAAGWVRPGDGDPPFPGFNAGLEPRPTPVMRVVPNV